MDTKYYQSRAVTERVLASASKAENVAAIHNELAQLYQALVEKAGMRPTLSIVALTREGCRLNGNSHSARPTFEPAL